MARGRAGWAGDLVRWRHITRALCIYVWTSLAAEIFIKPECSSSNYACVSFCGRSSWRLLCGNCECGAWGAHVLLLLQARRRRKAGRRAGGLRLGQDTAELSGEAHSICAFGFLKNALKARGGRDRAAGREAAQITANVNNVQPQTDSKNGREREKKLRWKRENYFLNSRLTGCQDASGVAGHPRAKTKDHDQTRAQFMSRAQ